MICLDTAVLIWGVQGASHPGQNEMIVRTRSFLELLVKEGETIMVPAPVVAEYLAGFEPAEQGKQLEALEKAFVIPSFDAAGALLAAQMFGQWELARQSRGIARQAFKVDTMVVATAIVHRATILVTDDSYLKNLVTVVGATLNVIEVPDISTQGNLFGPTSSPSTT